MSKDSDPEKKKKRKKKKKIPDYYGHLTAS